MSDFWSKERNQKSGWFGKLPPLQKISYTLLLLFVIGWCFYLGMTYAFATAPEIELDIKNDLGWKEVLREEAGEEVLRLTGMEVALLVGADKRPGGNKYRTDTIILAFYDWDNDDLKLLSIPRDSYVQFPGSPTKTKINEAYFYGGMALLESVIEYTFGIEVDHCVEIDFEGFTHLIDALGGVEIDVPRRMYKPSENINLEKGLKKLNGYDALGFVRFRDMPMGDIDRVANQQLFIRALAAKIAASSLFKAPELVTIGMQYTSSNFALTDALYLGAALYRTDLNNIPMYSLPGNGLYMYTPYGWISYWILSKKGVSDMITEITGGHVGDFHIITDEGKGVEKPPARPKDEDEDTADPDEEGTGLNGEDKDPAEGEEGGEPAENAEGATEDPQETSPETEQPQDIPLSQTPEPAEPDQTKAAG
ncbi:MAG: LCP family protein [Clostridiales bacterium]|nr:LCP family protein [Clostridiales bacterium]